MYVGRYGEGGSSSLPMSEAIPSMSCEQECIKLWIATSRTMKFMKELRLAGYRFSTYKFIFDPGKMMV